MFISVKHLHENMGVNEKIARFFVDRKVPEDNVFWKGKLLYISRGNGFMNIPVYYDILYRIGIPMEVLLEDGRVQCMERIMHFAIQVECGQISFSEQLDKISDLMQNEIQDHGFYHELMNYLRQEKLRPLGRLGIKPPALARADVFLFVLCNLPFSEDQLHSALKFWYALHPTYLLMDDIHDYKKDKENNEENAVVELGDGSRGFDTAFEIIEKNILELGKINPHLANTMQSQLAVLHDLAV